MSDLGKNNEKEFVDFIEKTTDGINSDKATENKNLSTTLENNTEYDEQTSKGIVDSISSTIDLTQDNFEGVQKAKEKGKSRSEWIEQELDKTIKTHKIDNPEELISETKEGLSESNTNIGVEVFGSEIDISKPLLSPEYNDLNKKAIANDFQEEITNNTLLGAITFESGNFKIDDTHKEIKAVKEYFDAQLDSPTDKSFKKAISTATVIAQEKELLPKKLRDKSPSEVAMIVDKGVTAAKIAYKIGKGEISPVDAVGYTIDRNVAILNSAITTACTRFGGKIGGKLGGFIGTIFGPVGTVAGIGIGTVVGKVGGYAVGKVIGKGVKKFGSAIKSAASRAWNGVKSVVSRAWNGVKSLLS